MPTDWPERPPPEFYHALAQFNQAQYYACHETLEALWIPERRSVRELYQGVLQIGVGCHHLTARANFIGATRKLDEGARRLARQGITEGLYGVQWSALIDAADRLREHVVLLGPERVSEHDRALLPVIVYHHVLGA